MVFDFLLSGRTLEEFQKTYRVEQKRLQSILRYLDEIKVLERHPGNKIKMLYRGGINWISNGPLQKKFSLEGIIHFIKTLSEMPPEEREKTRTATGTEALIRRETLEQFNTELRDLMLSFRRRAARDESLYQSAELLEVKWIVAMGPWPAPYARYLK